MLEEVGQFLLAAVHGLLERSALLHLGGERLRLLLELRNGPQALIRTRQRRVTLRRDNVGVRRTDRGELLGVGSVDKGAYGVCTQQREGIGLEEIIPECLEIESGVAVP